VKRLALVGPFVVALLAGTLGMSVAGNEPRLVAHGPTAVAGTEKTAVFRVGKRTVREVRYADRETLVYSFALANEGRVPVTVTGLAPLDATPRLFRYLSLTDTEGRERFTIPGGSRTTVQLSMQMHSCETLSARAGSFATHVSLHTERAAVIEDAVTVTLPEEVHTGSPREASCPNATATSRPPG
jgi:hypothetical protein